MTNTLSAWYGHIPGYFALLPFLLFCGYPLLRRDSLRQPAVMLAFVVILCYASFLVLSLSFFAALTPLDTRILSPMQPMVLLLLFHFPAWARYPLARRTLLIALLFMHSWGMSVHAQRVMQEGEGFGRLDMRNGI